MATYQQRLDEAIAESVSRGFGWVRPRKPNGRLAAWQVSIAGDDTFRVLIWPHYDGYIVSHSDPSRKMWVRNRSLIQSMKLAEQLASGERDVLEVQ